MCVVRADLPSSHSSQILMVEKLPMADQQVPCFEQLDTYRERLTLRSCLATFTTMRALLCCSILSAGFDRALQHEVTPMAGHKDSFCVGQHHVWQQLH